eukprot:2876423-Rhodomonas_salina.2
MLIYPVWLSGTWTRWPVREQGGTHTIRGAAFPTGACPIDVDVPACPSRVREVAPSWESRHEAENGHDRDVREPASVA